CQSETSPILLTLNTCLPLPIFLLRPFRAFSPQKQFSMARRSHRAKTQAEPMNPSPVVPNSQSETLPLNAQNVIPNGTTPSNMKVEKRRKNARTTTLVVRRSGRLNSPTRVNSEEPVPIVEDIIVPEVEKEEAVNQENNSPQKTQDTPTMQPSPVEVTHMANLNYRSLYIDSQKKVRSLMKKNRQLRKDLKFALGKIEVYAEMTPILSSLSKANEILCNRPWSMRRWRS
ncbi:hypothetical protein V2J09_021369, partial [Rumex salicifolius]